MESHTNHRLAGSGEETVSDVYLSPDGELHCPPSISHEVQAIVVEFEVTLGGPTDMCGRKLNLIVFFISYSVW